MGVRAARGARCCARFFVVGPEETHSHTYRSINNGADNNQRHSKPVSMVVEDQSNCCIPLSIAENASDDACYGAGIKVYLFLAKKSSVMTRLFNLLMLSSGFHLKKRNGNRFIPRHFFFFSQNHFWVLYYNTDINFHYTANSIIILIY